MMKIILQKYFVFLLLVLYSCSNPVPKQQENAIRFFPEGSLFANQLSVSLSYSETKTIVYTLNGETPSMNNLIVYTEPIILTTSSVIQAGVLQENGEITNIRGSIYLYQPSLTAPEIELATQQNQNGHTTAKVNVISSRTSNLSYRWYVNGRLQPEQSSTFEYNFQRHFDRTIDIEVRVFDGNAFAKESVSVFVPALQPTIDELGYFEIVENQDNTPPLVSLFAETSVLNYGERIQIRSNVIDPDNDTHEFVWKVNDEIVQRGKDNTLMFSQTPNATQNYLVSVLVSDGHSVRTSFISLLVNQTQPQAIIEQVQGNVSIETFDGKTIVAQRGMALNLSDTIHTAFNSSAIISTNNSSIAIDSLSRVTLDALEATGNTQTTSLFMRVGSVSAEVDSSRTSGSFEVVAPHATASVRGTSFRFDGTNLQVYSGSVAVRIGPPQRNVQRQRQEEARRPAESSSEEEEPVSETSEEETSSTESDEVVVEEGEELTIELAEGLDFEDATMNFNVDEYRVPQFATVNVNIFIQDIPGTIPTPIEERTIE